MESDNDLLSPSKALPAMHGVHPARGRNRTLRVVIHWLKSPQRSSNACHSSYATLHLWTARITPASFHKETSLQIASQAPTESGDDPLSSSRALPAMHVVPPACGRNRNLHTGQLPHLAANDRRSSSDVASHVGTTLVCSLETSTFFTRFNKTRACESLHRLSWNSTMTYFSLQKRSSRFTKPPSVARAE